MRRGTAKDALNRIRWSPGPGEDWEELAIVIRHHGAPGDEKSIVGSRVTRLESSFFEVDGETLIPYHRVKRILVRDRLVYERLGSSSAKRSS